MKWILGLIGLVVIAVAVGYFALRRPDISYQALAARYESPASRYMDLPGEIHMHYRDEGAAQPEGAPIPTILLIHGYSASLHTWAPWVERLKQNDYRIISLDLPGHGLTSAPAGYRASIPAYVEAVRAFTQAMHLTRFAVAGNSMGGNVAWEYALAHPEQIDALILVDSAGWPHPEDNAAEDAPMMRLLENPAIGPVLRNLDNTRLFRQGLRASFANADLADEAMITRYVELSRAPGHRNILLQLRTGYSGRRVASNETLAAIATPTLILWGAQDHLIPVADAEKFHNAIAGSEVIVYDGAGHILQEEKADDTAMAVHEFLYRVHEQGMEAMPAAE